MANTKWTPGPWTIHRNEDQGVNASVRQEGTGTFIAMSMLDLAHGPGQVEANLALIAAAPNLYAALADLVDAVDRLGTVMSPRMNAARAALAKARGA